MAIANIVMCIYKLPKDAHCASLHSKKLGNTFQSNIILMNNLSKYFTTIDADLGIA